VVSPIYSYNHNGANASITGGYVYRGDGEALQGQYFFADFVQGKVFTLRFDGSAWVATDRTSQITTDVGALTHPSSFGEDGRGNLYIVDFGGNIFRLTPTVASADQGDVLHGFGGNDMLFGGSGDDLLDGGPGADTLNGGPGTDTADYSSSSAAVTVNLQTGLASGGDAQGDILNDIENIQGSAFNDTLIGDGGANTLAGGPGADTLVGAGGNDILFGGDGNDVLIGGADSASIGATYMPAGAIGTNWHIIGTSDASGDRNADYVWNNGGMIAVWIISNGVLTGSALINGAIGSDWNAKGTGDFNHDGLADVLWSNNGQVAVWELNGSNIVNSGLSNGQIGTSFSFVPLGTLTATATRMCSGSATAVKSRSGPCRTPR